MGERWVILLMREAFYGVTRFDGFQRALGIAPNILSARLRKLVQYGIFVRVPTSAHRGRYDYRLTDKGRDFFPAYVALKCWGDRWMAGPKGPLVLFREKMLWGRRRDSAVKSSLRSTPIDGAPLC